ncbi:hypothetical protein FBU31_003333 [Coemansia sp. 'formosensis']|nr:hypothetical protein FBU31_003333 [Coemansia sp. 'formosensis']
MKHRTQLSSNLSHGAPNQLPHIPVPRLLSESGRARSYTSAESREPAIVMTDDIRPARMRELTATLQAKHREQLRSAENMALVAAATRRASARQLPEPLHSIQSPQYSSLTPPPPPPLPSRRLFARSPVSASGSRQSPTPAAPEYMAYIAAMHAAGHVDLEEFLIQEAIRQSLADQEATAESGASQSEPITETDTTPTSASPSDPSGEQHTGILSVVSMLDNLDVTDSPHHEEAADATPLVLDESELDAIANVTSRPRPALSSAATSPVLTAVAAAPSPDDLMSFAAVDPFAHDDTAASSMMTLRSPSSPSGRPRRRPPPPPPPTHPKQQRGADDDTQSQTPLILL